jgi:hypothetical protein
MKKEYDECMYCKQCKLMKYRVNEVDGYYFDFCTFKCAVAYIKENPEEFILRLDY